MKQALWEIHKLAKQSSDEDKIFSNSVFYATVLVIASSVSDFTIFFSPGQVLKSKTIPKTST